MKPITRISDRQNEARDREVATTFVQNKRRTSRKGTETEQTRLACPRAKVVPLIVPSLPRAASESEATGKILL
jgi:hypothetical protein